MTQRVLDLVWANGPCSPRVVALNPIDYEPIRAEALRGWYRFHSCDPPPPSWRLELRTAIPPVKIRSCASVPPGVIRWEPDGPATT